MTCEIPRPRKYPFRTLYLSAFILAFHLYFVMYINSSFLSLFVGEARIGIVYIASAILSILALMYVSYVLRKFGNYRLLVTLAIVEFFSFLGLAFLHNVYLVIPIFVIYSIIFPILFFNLDIFLECLITEAKEQTRTGSIRGIYITFTNLALILAPLIAGLTLADSQYGKIYLISAFLLIPFLIVISRYHGFKDPIYHDIHVRETIGCMKGNEDLGNIFAVESILQFFFACAGIYMPLYLHAHIGFDWSQIGIMIAIMLLPYVLIEYPAGRLADIFGERKILILGFIIGGLFTGLIAFIPLVPDVIFWTAIMFIIRVGISLVEITTESYFFKHVDGSDNNTISFFRITMPVSYITGPLVGTLALSFLNFQYFWIILGALLFIGIIYSLRLKPIRQAQ